MCSGPSTELILAPVRGITDCVYRTAFAHWFPGFDRAVAPFVQPRQGHALRSGERRQLIPENNRGLPVIPQVLAHQAGTFVAALRELQDLGYDHANWNLGCPSRAVAGRGRGAGLLPFPDRIDAILDAVLSQCTVALSVKLRLGVHSSEELLPVIDILNRYPLTEVILHPRTVKQMYEGELDVHAAQEAAAVCRHRFALSGGITSVRDYEALRQELPGVTSWMIGRGALSCPSLPSLIKGEDAVDAETYRTMLHIFHDDLLNGYTEWLSGPAHLLAKMREHWVYLAACFAEPKKVAKRIRRARHIEGLRQAVDWAFDQPLKP